VMNDLARATIEAPFVQTEDDQEYKLIRTAAEAVHQGNWIVGECAARWYHRYRKERTDGDFGDMIGLSEDRVFQCRRVWEEFNSLHQQLSELTWSHFREALNWEDAEQYLRWASDTEATVREMSACRKVKRGEPPYPGPAAPAEKPAGRTAYEDRTPAKPAARETIQAAEPAPTKPAVASAPTRVVDTADGGETVAEAIERVSGLVQFVVKHGTEQDRLRLVGVLKPLLDGLKGSGR
jgi:hypothetical protein